MKIRIDGVDFPDCHVSYVQLKPDHLARICSGDRTFLRVVPYISLELRAKDGFTIHSQDDDVFYEAK